MGIEPISEDWDRVKDSQKQTIVASKNYSLATKLAAPVAFTGKVHKSIVKLHERL